MKNRDLKGKRLLVASFDVDFAHGLKWGLNELNADQIDIADNEKDALNLLCQSQRYDLVCLSLALPPDSHYARGLRQEELKSRELAEEKAIFAKLSYDERISGKWYRKIAYHQERMGNGFKHYSHSKIRNGGLYLIKKWLDHLEKEHLLRHELLPEIVLVTVEDDSTAAIQEIKQLTDKRFHVISKSGKRKHIVKYISAIMNVAIARS